MIIFISINREYQADLDFKGLTMSDPVSVSCSYFLNVLRFWSVVNLFISLNPKIECPDHILWSTMTFIGLSHGSPMIICNVLYILTL